MPQFMRNADKKRKQLKKIAENSLGHELARDEAAILRSGVGVYVDSYDRDPVTGLYRLHFLTGLYKFADNCNPQIAFPDFLGGI